MMRSLPVGTFRKAIEAVNWIETNGNDSQAQKIAIQKYDLSRKTIERATYVKNSVVFVELSAAIEEDKLALEHAGTIASQPPETQKELLDKYLFLGKTYGGRLLRGGKKKKSKSIQLSDTEAVFDELLMLITRLEEEGGKTMVTMSPPTVSYLTFKVKKLILDLKESLRHKK